MLSKHWLACKCVDENTPDNFDVCKMLSKVLCLLYISDGKSAYQELNFLQDHKPENKLLSILHPKFACR